MSNGSSVFRVRFASWHTEYWMLDISGQDERNLFQELAGMFDDLLNEMSVAHGTSKSKARNPPGRREAARR